MAAPTGDTQASVFDDHFAAWEAWQQEPWSRVRYAVVAHVLDTHIGDADRLRVLDVGGGDGMDSVRLAVAGHDVTILDHSGAMLRRARESSLAQGLEDRVHLLSGDVGDLPALQPAQFDVVLCHFVVQYLAEPGKAIGDIVAAARVDGLVSLVAPNPVSEVLAKVVREKDPKGALEMIDATSFHAAAFDHDVARIDWRTAAGHLRAAGAEVVGRYGSRSVIDLIDDDGFTADAGHLADIVDLEVAVCARSPYRDVARAWQLVARRR